MIYHTEIFENLKIGDTKRAYVKNIRDDNKIDISLQNLCHLILQQNLTE